MVLLNFAQSNATMHRPSLSHCATPDNLPRGRWQRRAGQLVSPIERPLNPHRLPAQSRQVTRQGLERAPLALEAQPQGGHLENPRPLDRLRVEGHQERCPVRQPRPWLRCPPLCFLQTTGLGGDAGLLLTPILLGATLALLTG